MSPPSSEVIEKREIMLSSLVDYLSYEGGRSKMDPCSLLVSRTRSDVSFAYIGKDGII